MQDIYKHYNCESNPDAHIIELPKNVLGGNEALEFSIIIDKYCTEKCSTLIIDLSQVELMNSSGLGMLVAALSKSRKHNKQLCLVSVPEKVLSLLKMTHLNQLFKIYESQKFAIGSI